MIVYYKRMANAIMLLGAVLGGVFGLIYFHGQILNNPDKTAVFVWALWVFAGVIVGRLLAAMLANKRLQAVQNSIPIRIRPASCRTSRRSMPVSQRTSQSTRTVSTGFPLRRKRSVISRAPGMR